MRPNQVDGGSETAERRGDSQVVRRPQAVGSEHLHIRSYDYQWAYDLDIEITDDSGTVVFEDRHYLQPGHSRSLTGVLTAGTYDVTVTLDNTLRRRLRCRIDDSIENTAVIEVGNGTVSLTTGHTR